MGKKWNGDAYWLGLGPISKAERKQAFTYLRRHNLPTDNQHLRHRVARTRKRREINRYLKGKEEATTDPANPWQIIYGSIQAGGTITFIHTSGPADQPNLYLHLIITLAAHEINYLQAVNFDGYQLTWGTALTTRPTAVVNATGIFDGYVKMQVNYGSDSQAALSEAVADVPTKWTSNHRQRGHAHVYLRLNWHETIFKNGTPDITFQVLGKYDVTDPRTGSPSPGAQNAAMVLYDYMRNARWGLGLSSTDFNTTRLNQACTDCEDSISLAGGGSENRYLISTHFGADASPGSIVEEMLASMSGRLPYVKGEFVLWVGKARAATVMTITADMILSEIQVGTKVPRSDSFNRVRGTFVSSQNNYEESDFPAVKNATYVTADNNEVVYEDLTYTMVTSAATAQRLSKIELEENRQGITVEFTARMDAYQAEPGEWVAVTYSRFGWSAKVFEVVRSALVIEQDPSGSPYFAVHLALRETASGVYDWNTGNETTFDVAPNTDLPNPFTVADPTGLTLASGTTHLYIKNDGTVITRLYVSWTAAADAFVVNGGGYELQFKKSAASDWQDAGRVPGGSTNYYILDVDDGNAYDVRIRSVSAMGARGNWVTATGHTVIGKTAAPSDPTGLTGTLQGYGIKLSWTAVADLDVKEYEIRITTVPGGTINDTTAIAWIRTTTFYYEPKTSAVYRFYVRAIDTSGNYSGNTVYVDVTVALPSTPTVTSAVDGDGFLLSWNAVTGSFAIKEYVIRHGASYAAGSAVATVSALKFKVVGDWRDFRTFWVAPVDIAGNVGTAGSVITNIIPPGSVSNLSAKELNGTVLVDWDAPIVGTMPVRKYKVYEGPTFAYADFLGSVDGTFFTMVYPTGGDFVFWVLATDSAGNDGPESSTPLAVLQPPGYTLEYDRELVPAEAVAVVVTEPADVENKAEFYSMMDEWAGYTSTFIAAVAVGGRLEETYYDRVNCLYKLKDRNGNAYTAELQRAHDEHHYHINTFCSPAGAVAGYRIFPEGFLEEINRASSRAAAALANITAMLANGAYVNTGVPNDLSNATGDWDGSNGGARECAMALHLFIYAELAGITLTPTNITRRQQLFEWSLGHLEQYSTGTVCRYMKCFMAAIVVKSMIAYYDHVDQDSRILPLVEAVAQRMKDNCWHSTAGSWGVGGGFIYAEIFIPHPTNSGGYYSPSEDPYTQVDLNMLIAPVYAWLWYQTGVESWRTFGQEIFTASIPVYDIWGFWVSGANLNTRSATNPACKQYQQQLFWSDKFIEWMESAPVTSGADVSSTVSNLVIETDGLSVAGPANLTETWQQHFTSNSATTIQDLIDDGYEYWVQPGSLEIGVVEWEVDLGADFVAATLTTECEVTPLVGPPVVIPQLFWRASSVDPWTRGTPGSFQQRATDYRYAKVRYEIGGDILDPADATLTNAVDMEDGQNVFLPVASDQTWEEHFTDAGFTTIQNFIDAGYTTWLQPGPIDTNAVAQWDVDCGVVVDSSAVTLSFDITQLEAGQNTDLSFAVHSRRSATDEWTIAIAETDLSSGSGVQMATDTLTDFRHLRVYLYATSTVANSAALAQVYTTVRVGDESNVMSVGDFRLQVGVITRTDSGVVTVNSGDVGGTEVEFNLPFVDVISITASPDGSTDLRAVPSFTDLANPETFSMYLFDTNGDRASGTVRWVATGIVQT